MLKKKLIFAFLIFAFWAGTGMAENINILPIKPVPSIKESKTQKVVAKIQEFDFSGELDRIGQKEIVINDSLYKLSSFVQYYSEDGKIVLKSSFIEGEFVGVNFDSQKQVNLVRKLY